MGFMVLMLQVTLFGALMGATGGIVVASILGFMSITAKADQVVAGTGINILFLGLTSYLLNIIFGIGAKPSKVNSFVEVPLPLLSDIPILGDVLFNQIPLVYLAIILVPICWYIVYKTSFGLNMRAVGENPRAADSVGLNVIAIRYIAIVISGFLGGLGGAFLSIGHLSVFMENDCRKRLCCMVFSYSRQMESIGILGAALLSERPKPFN